MTAWPCDKIPPPPQHKHPGAIKAKFGLDLITCTPRDKIHVVNHAVEPLHYYSRIRSFEIPTIPSPITTSLLNKTSRNTIFIQFCILISHQNKIYSLNTTTNFLCGFREAETTTVWHQYFRGSLILPNGDFCVCFAGLIFAIGETVYPSLELIFAIFRKPPSIWN